MHIGIDARMFGPRVGGGGLGRYVEQLVGHLQTIEHEDQYTLFLKKDNLDTCTTSGPRFQKHLADIHWYGLAEQTRLPKLIDRTEADLVHFPHWNVPLKIRTPFVVTIHDLILLEEPRSAKATTRHPLIYQAKYWLFKRVLTHAVETSEAIIAVTEYTKASILKHFPSTDPNKIHVIYEGLTSLPIPKQAKTSNQFPHPYFLYVGNAYPHKNLSTLLAAFASVLDVIPESHLTLAGRADVFYERLQKEINAANLSEHVTIVPNPTDEELSQLFAGAQSYVFPSRIEGFGLPPLEAMHFDLPVASSNTTCLPEVLGDAAHYFDPNDPRAMAQAMIDVFSDTTLRATLINKGKQQIKQYSWSRMAQEIHDLYHTCAPTT